MSEEYIGRIDKDGKIFKDNGPGCLGIVLGICALALTIWVGVLIGRLTGSVILGIIGACGVLSVFGSIREGRWWESLFWLILFIVVAIIF